MPRNNHNRLGLGLGTSATRLRAGGVRRPTGEFAIDGTTETVASKNHLESF
jgi:hypothetical protein